MTQGSTAPIFGVQQSILGQPWLWRADASTGLAIAQACDVPEAVGLIIAGRGGDIETASRLMKPTLRDYLPDPSIFQDMGRAAQRIADALSGGEPIVIFGDYDVDGATSTALLLRYLRQLGAKVSAYIPDRLLEGYGPSADAMVALGQAGAKLIITVDCGTQAFEALAAAKGAGIDVIVIDHHKAGWALPEAYALVNPNRLDEAEEASQFGHLAAVGVAFLLAIAVNRVLRENGFFSRAPAPDLLSFLDLVALGTVADVALLTGLNRAFVAQGLKVLASRGNVGLAMLSDIAGVDQAPTATTLGFHLGPRINAGGRVGKSDLGTRLLSTEDPIEARALAEELDRLNGERRALEAFTLEQALECASDDPVVVAVGEGWHPGVIGIVAGRLKERYGRPAVVIGVEKGVGKGSGRSITGVDLGSAILAAKDMGLLQAGGGHAMAAGLTIAENQIPSLRAFLNERLSHDVEVSAGKRSLRLDAALAPGGVTHSLAKAMEMAGPYGMGWPAPKVAVGPMTILRCDLVGQDHLRLILSGRDGGRVKAVAFRHAETALGQALVGAGRRPLALAGRLVADEWGGATKAELHIEDGAFLDD